MIVCHLWRRDGKRTGGYVISTFRFGQTSSMFSHLWGGLLYSKNQDLLSSSISPLSPSTITIHASIHKANLQEVESLKIFLEKERRYILNSVEHWTKKYLWHLGQFELELILPSTDTSDPHLEGSNCPLVPHLIGRTKFGESIEDEWFIVWLLLIITRRYESSVS